MYNFFGYVVIYYYIEMWKGNLVIKKYGRSTKILHGDKFHNTAEVINIDQQKNMAKKYG